MHNNYYFLTRLVRELEPKITGSTLTNCFSQNKDELIISFDDGFTIKAALDSNFSCLSFPNTFYRARKNSIDLFEKLQYKKVTGIRQFENERCFAIEFENDLNLIFKMHGNRSNIILFEHSNLRDVFKSKLKNDFNLSITTLDRSIDQSYENFKLYDGDLNKLFPTFGKELKSYLNREFLEQSLEDRWELIQSVKKKLASGKFYICRYQQKLHLSLVEIGDTLRTYEGAIEAINDFFTLKVQTDTFNPEKNKALTDLGKKLIQTQKYITVSSQKLEELQSGTSYSQIGDILMANLTTISKGVDNVLLENFYNHNKTVRIKLNRNLTPQKNAENYYRKSKNQSKELEILKQNIHLKQQIQSAILQQIEAVKNSENLKGLRKIIKLETAQTRKKIPKPFSEIEYLGYKIQIGKNAKSNDIMLRSYSQKNDLWLHAKDVSGSHVIIREIPGKKFPKSLIERGAEIAAFHSKKRNETLCPVIYTPRKFVRKRKGDPAGAVVVEREKIILVNPKA
ncbi:MAG: NFACT RNA binding domain-containing protein [Bacteroidota bacterium]